MDLSITEIDILQISADLRDVLNSSELSRQSHAKELGSNCGLLLSYIPHKNTFHI